MLVQYVEGRFVPLAQPVQIDSIEQQNEQSLNEGYLGSAERQIKLCKSCEVIPFDDKAAGGLESRDLDGEPTLGLPEFMELPLNYEARDSLPDLNRLAESSTAGCEFCQFLRAAILRHRFDVRCHINIRLSYIWGLKYNKPARFGLMWLFATVDSLDGSLSTNLTFLIEAVNSQLDGQQACNRWLRLMPPSTHQSLSKKNVSEMKQFIQICTQECDHPLSPNPLFLPKRLLDVRGSSTAAGVRLIATERLQSHTVKYAALSYCWGSPEHAKQQLTTTTSSLPARLESISFGELSKVMKDAVTVCRRLSIPYIWIDSLCIVQDNREDWEDESKNMGLIYANAFVTIVASSSSSCNEGFISEAGHTLRIPFRSRLKDFVEGEYALVDNMEQGRKTLHEASYGLNSAWWKRGWTLQESLLSRRLLYFNKRGLYFLCSRADVHDSTLWKSRGQIFPLEVIQQWKIGTATTDELFEAWYASLSHYSTRRVTFAEDRFPAISGIASLFSDVLGYAYVAGLWKEDFKMGLLWHVHASQYDPNLHDHVRTLSSAKQYISPSWSWANEHRSTLYHGHLTPLSLRENHQSEVEVINCDIAFREQDTNEFGRIQGAKAELRGLLAPMPLKIEANSGPFFPMITTCWNKTHWLIIYPDWNIHSEQEADWNGVEMLLLVSTPDTPNTGHPLLNHRPQMQLPKPKGSLFESQPWLRQERSLNQTLEPHRHGWGILLYPARKLGEYYRVGTFHSSPKKETYGQGAGLRPWTGATIRHVVLI